MADASGKFVLRMPKQLHAALREAARKHGVSLNRFCVDRLSGAVGQVEGEPSGPRVNLPAIDLERIERAWGDIAEGVVLFGSTARQETWDTSDVDLLVVVRQGVAVTRDLYDRWNPVADESTLVSPLIAALPPTLGEAGGVWYEAAVDGIVVWDPNLHVSTTLTRLRREIAEGRIVRRYVHGQPYWIKTERAA